MPPVDTVAGDKRVIGTRISDGEKFALALDGEFVGQVSGLLGSQMLHFDLKASGDGDKLILSFSNARFNLREHIRCPTEAAELNLYAGMTDTAAKLLLCSSITEKAV